MYMIELKNNYKSQEEKQMKKINKIITILMIILMLTATSVQAHGGNITGWKDKNSDKITLHDGKYYGYHNQDGKRHYHEVEWNEEAQKWEILKSAVYYDENFNIIDNTTDEKTEKVQVKFIEKVDGDTAKFELNSETITVRFLGINTPETVHPTKGEEPFGKEASSFTEEKLKNATKIELEYDNNASKTDKYERHLAWIWVDDVLLQEQIVKNGLAETYMLQDNYKYAGILQVAEEEAKSQKIGVWSGENTENTETEVVNEATEETYADEANQENIVNDSDNTENAESDGTEKPSNMQELLWMLVVFAVGILAKALKKKK